MRTKTVRNLFRAVALLIGFGVSVVLGELAVTALVSPAPPTYSELVSMVGNHYEPSPYNPFTVRPHFSGQTQSMEFPGRQVDVRTNAFGMRSPEVELEKPDGTQRILVLGDSYTFGVYVHNEDTYSARLEDLLTVDGDRVEVLNAGYTAGWETDHHYSWLINRGFDFDPDIVVLGFFVGNDIMNLRPSLWEETDSSGLPTRIVDPLVYVDQVGRLRRTRAYDDDEIVDIEVVSRTVGDEFIYRIPWLRESRFLVYLGVAIDQLVSEASRRAEQAPERTILYPHIFKRSDARFDAQEAIFLDLVEGLAEACRERGIEFVVLIIPFNFQVEPHFLPAVIPEFRRRRVDFEKALVRDYPADLEPKLEARGIPYVNLLKSMREQPGHYYHRNGEVHFNPRGHLFAAKQLAGKMTDLGWRGDEAASATRPADAEED